MPANPKYLTYHKGKRTLKIVTGLLGGYLLTVSLNSFFCFVFDTQSTIYTSFFGAILVWTGLFILSFLVKKTWIVTLSYFLATTALLLCIEFYFKK